MRCKLQSLRPMAFNEKGKSAFRFSPIFYQYELTYKRISEIFGACEVTDDRYFRAKGSIVTVHMSEMYRFW